ncbi:DUF4861 domain-containing protein [Joostella atrarenae]|uniref:DUF4861 domain-containing protein n=1 Tax=Joostella atrarenae TaxID=679257 RepID=A0ABS9IZ46_9FLAO|nr:DUF4861 domain-containing protein [Joostella atrarenae]MCF8713456.1 DUF4861 domain-containing protein [Joostella atrarenae]
MKTLIYSLTILAVILSSCSEEQNIITVENKLAINRTNETVEVRLSDLKQNATNGVNNWRIRDIEEGKEVTSQLIDEDNDGKWDLIIFQPSIEASSKKEFQIYPVTEEVSKDTTSFCYSRFVPERTDDYAWENNKVAFRTYGPVAQKMVEDSVPGGTLSSGMDAWLKRVDYPIINKWYKKTVTGKGSYHKDTGEGLDNFHVGKSRGIGGIAKKVDTTYYLSKNFSSWKTITNGPIRTSFVLTYIDWDADGNVISEEKHISLDYGQNLSRFELHIDGVNSISTGITLHQQKGVTNTNKEEGWMSYWEPHEDSELGLGVVTDRDNIIEFEKYITPKKDESNLYAELNLKQGKVVYYAGFGWKKSKQFENQKEWEAYLSDFSKKLQSPLLVSLN